MYKGIHSTQIDLIFNGLKTFEIMDYLSQSEIEKKKLLLLIIESGAGFRDMIKMPDCLEFIECIEEHSVYKSDEFADLVIFVATMGLVKTDEEQLSLLNKFLIFHKILYKTGSLVQKLSLANISRLNENKSNDNKPIIIPDPVNYIETDKIKPILIPVENYNFASSPIQEKKPELVGNEEIGLAEFLKSLSSN